MFRTIFTILLIGEYIQNMVQKLLRSLKIKILDTSLVSEKIIYEALIWRSVALLEGI